MTKHDPFLNDGCTGFINGIGKADWRGCCDAHDPAFLNGQTVVDFVKANVELLTCVSNEGFETGFEIAASGEPPWSYFEAGLYMTGVPIVAVAMFGVVGTIGWFFFKRGKWKK